MFQNKTKINLFTIKTFQVFTDLLPGTHDSRIVKIIHLVKKILYLWYYFPSCVSFAIRKKIRVSESPTKLACTLYRNLKLCVCVFLIVSPVGIFFVIHIVEEKSVYFKRMFIQTWSAMVQVKKCLIYVHMIQDLLK